jgi:Carbohydrate-selective porin, OprB family
MRRLLALWRSRCACRKFVVALTLPLAAESALADEWSGSRQGDVAYTLCSKQQATPQKRESAPVLTAPADDTSMPADEMPYDDRECACQTCQCGADSNCWCAKNLLCDDWAAPLKCCGIGADFELTQFYQGVASGGQEQDWAYGGKLDYFFTVDGQKLGLLHGLSAAMHAETRFGEDVNFDAVGLAPVNANMLYPLPGVDTTAITGFLLNQQLNEQWVLSAGKFNLLDLFDQLYPQTGRGIDGFMNISALAPLTLARTLNLSIMGAGATLMHGKQVQGAVSVVDTHNSSTTSGFDDLFDNGAVIIGFYRFFHEMTQAS